MTEETVTRIVLNNENESIKNNKGKKKEMPILEINNENLKPSKNSSRTLSSRGHKINNDENISKTDRSNNSSRKPLEPSLKPKTPKDFNSFTSTRSEKILDSVSKSQFNSKDKLQHQKSSLFARTKTFDNLFKQRESNISLQETVFDIQVTPSESIQQNGYSPTTPLTKQLSQRLSTSNTPHPVSTNTTVTPGLRRSKTTKTNDHKKLSYSKSLVSVKPTSDVLYGYPCKIELSILSVNLGIGIRKGDLIYFSWKIDHNSGISSVYPVTDPLKTTLTECLNLKVMIVGNIDKKFLLQKNLVLQMKQLTDLDKPEKSCSANDPVVAEFVVNLALLISLHKDNAYIEAKSKIKDNSSKSSLKFSFQTRRILEGYSMEGMELQFSCAGEQPVQPQQPVQALSTQSQPVSQETTKPRRDLRRVNSRNTEMSSSLSSRQVSFSRREENLEVNPIIMQLEEKCRILEMKYKLAVEQCHNTNRLYDELYNSTQQASQKTNEETQPTNLSQMFSTDKPPTEPSPTVDPEQYRLLKQMNKQLIRTQNELLSENKRLENQVKNLNEEIRKLNSQQQEFKTKFQLLSEQCFVFANGSPMPFKSLIGTPPGNENNLLLPNLPSPPEKAPFQQIQNYFKKLEETATTNSK